jgi:hypothetical protein
VQFFDVMAHFAFHSRQSFRERYQLADLVALNLSSVVYINVADHTVSKIPRLANSPSSALAMPKSSCGVKIGCIFPEFKLKADSV